MAQEIELLEEQSIPVEEGAEFHGREADKAEEVVIDSSLLSSMEEKLVSIHRTKSSPSTICRVPEKIRKCDPAAYNPSIVSIGPFHRRGENLQAMEEHKWRSLQKGLDWDWGKGRNINLEEFLKKMKEIETQARNSYSEHIQMSSNEFLEMMVLDGWFIIWLILQRNHDFDFDVLIYGNRWMLQLIKHDMLLLENQLPFLVLECLWELISLPKHTLMNGALTSFNNLFPCNKLELKNPEDHVIHHLLHLLHLCLKPDPPPRKAQTTSASGKLSLIRLCQNIGKTLCPTYLINAYSGFLTPSQQSPRWVTFPSATELQEAGVRFQLKQARSFFEVRFEQGLMEMSRLSIFDGTDIIFRNIIALEQCFTNLGKHFTTYCWFLDNLVNTPRDVSILKKADIIRNGLGSDEEVSLFLNKLCKDIVWSVDGSQVAVVFGEVNQHTQKSWPRWRAKLVHNYFSNPWAVHDYFSNPWAMISLIAAVIILILTFLQTCFSALDYFNPPKS